MDIAQLNKRVTHLEELLISLLHLMRDASTCRDRGGNETAIAPYATDSSTDKMQWFRKELSSKDPVGALRQVYSGSQGSADECMMHATHEELKNIAEALQLVISTRDLIDSGFKTLGERAPATKQWNPQYGQREEYAHRPYQESRWCMAKALKDLSESPRQESRGGLKVDGVVLKGPEIEIAVQEGMLARQRRLARHRKFRANFKWMTLLRTILDPLQEEERMRQVAQERITAEERERMRHELKEQIRAELLSSNSASLLDM